MVIVCAFARQSLTRWIPQFGRKWIREELPVSALKFRFYADSLEGQPRNCRPLILGRRPPGLDDNQVELLPKEEFDALFSPDWYPALRASIEEDGLWPIFGETLHVGRGGEILAGHGRALVFRGLCDNDEKWLMKHGNGRMLTAWVAVDELSAAEGEVISLVLQCNASKQRGLRQLTPDAARAQALQGIADYVKVRSFLFLQHSLI